jgi:hypothetical protein
MMGLTFWIDIVRVLLSGLMIMVSSGQAMATLGKAPSAFPVASASTPVSAAKKSAVSPVAQSSLYTLHEVQLENGTVVREYATTEGLVFAVAWRGPVLPDLNALLGDYFKTFKSETDQARLVGRRGSPVNIQSDGLVIVSNGRMRNFFGYAYAPDLVPVGVNIKDVLQ